jgi:peptidoglycan/LPS O-acetylase OafA/YrhL
MFGLQVDLNKRYHGLDLARAIAICLVVFAHSLWISDFYPEIVSWLMGLSGTIGVEIFFVISGFLIGRIVLRLLEDENFSLSSIFEFLKRRWFRTLPNYYLILFVNVLLWWLVYHKIPEQLYLYFVYLQNMTKTSPDFYRVSWSLAVEQFCYIIGPFFLLLLVKVFPKSKRRHLFLWMSFFMIFVFFCTRLYFNYSHDLQSITDWNQSLRKVTIYRLDAIYYGFILYYLYSRKKIDKKWNKPLLILGLTGIFILHIFIFAIGVRAEVFQFFFTVLYLPINSIVICFIIPYLVELRLKETLFLKFIATLSIISYSIYLLHYTVILHTLKVIFPSEELRGIQLLGYTLFYWFVVLVLSYLLYRYFEKPMTSLREKNKA